MKEKIRTRINQLRSWMQANGLSAFIIPSSDPHQSEYVSPYWMSREWLSGFSGSAGTIVVTLNQAGLWTDARYFLQAADQLSGTSISLFKMALPNTPSYEEWLCCTVPSDNKVGIDGSLFSINDVESMKINFQKKGIVLNSSLEPFSTIWANRPKFPLNKAFIYETRFAGVSATNKINRVREYITSKGIDTIIIPALDEIAWTLNLRGEDVKDTPVIVSYLIISKNTADYFIYANKLTNEIRTYLDKLGVTIRGYNELDDFLGKLSQSTILVDPSQTSYHILQNLPDTNKIIRSISPIAFFKAVKNETEIIGLYKAMTRDGVALVKFLIWLEQAVPANHETEISIDRKLHKFRSEQALYIGESFDTIAGYKEHAAIIHYSATVESDIPVSTDGSILIDSGAQYLDGTTDITRTILLGNITEEEKKDYTLVLKGNIALASAKFPRGTRGTQLDVLARSAMWHYGINFLHGTGHGIGHFLNVHEGPQAIRMNDVPVTLQPGMTISDEPGIYKKGKHGIRIENILSVCMDSTSEEFGDFYRFETMTLCPIDTKPIIKELLHSEEIEWLNNYHEMVYNKISPFLNAKEKIWLHHKTQRIDNTNVKEPLHL